MSWPSGNRHESTVHLSDDQMGILGELAEDSEYWGKAKGFILQVQDRELSSLTPAQLDWYYNIDVSLLHEIDLREARIAFGEDSEQYKHVR